MGHLTWLSVGDIDVDDENERDEEDDRDDAIDTDEIHLPNDDEIVVKQKILIWWWSNKLWNVKAQDFLFDNNFIIIR